uniref:Uncharacterized protein n=1 Tax=Pipistrellus kuhlii TaxID=59472 RepID=A0A7J7TW54_PIPKU|nr:hypothetical protein mPipKuh1_009283 [Pipistrellus kuhlii]
MHSLVDSYMFPDQRSNLKPWHSRRMPQLTESPSQGQHLTFWSRNPKAPRACQAETTLQILVLLASLLPDFLVRKTGSAPRATSLFPPAPGTEARPAVRTHGRTRSRALPAETCWAPRGRLRPRRTLGIRTGRLSVFTRC